MSTTTGPDLEGAVGMKVPLARPWVDEQEAQAAFDVIRTGWLIQGPRVAEFEQRFADMVGARHGIAVNSGSSALLVSMAAMGVGPGDEVICPNMTFVSTASAALFLGARPVFADIEMDYYGLDPADLERCITTRTKAIVPVHYAGHTAEMAPILEVAERRGIAVLEDAAESHLATYNGEKQSGTLGTAGIFSFTPSKPMTTGEGGMIVTDDDELADTCRRFRNFGDVSKFEWAALGFNFRLPEALGAMGLVQLGRLEEAVRRRREIGRRYTEALADTSAVIPPKERTPTDGNYQLYTVRLDPEQGAPAGDQVRSALAARGVGSRLYYPPLHNQGVFSASAGTDADYPNTLAYAATSLSLPIFPTLTSDEQDFVIESLKASLHDLQSATT